MISIIIVNWNADHQLHDCINSIKQYHKSLVEQVVIVDNASTDNSLSLVESLTNLPFDLKIIRNNQNRGFAAACNQGAAIATAKYLLFLNPDTLLFENSLENPYRHIENPSNQNIGIIGIQLIDESGNISRSCARFPTLAMFTIQIFGMDRLGFLSKYNIHMKDWEHNTTQPVDHVIGAFYFIKKTLFKKTKGFDERFFVYLEDLDLSLKVKKTGAEIIYLTDAQAFHAGGGTSRNVKATRLFYSLRSRVLYGFKNFRKPQALLLLILTIFFEPISRILYSVARGKFSELMPVIIGYKMLYLFLAKKPLKGKVTS